MIMYIIFSYYKLRNRKMPTFALNKCIANKLQMRKMRLIVTKYVSVTYITEPEFDLVAI